MKARYTVVIIIFSIIINLISVNDFLLVMSSLLLLLLVFVSNLYVKLVDRAQKVTESDRTMISRNIASYGSTGITRTMNRFAIIFSLIVIYIMGITAFLLQLNHKSKSISHFLLNGALDGDAQGLSGVGWTIFVVSLLLVTIHVIQLIRTKVIFKK